MLAKQNLTAAIEPGLLKKARAAAARRGLSVSALLAAELRELVAEDIRDAAARKRAAALLSTPWAARPFAASGCMTERVFVDSAGAAAASALDPLSRQRVRP